MICMHRIIIISSGLKRKSFFIAFNANACRAFGRGIQPKGLRMREKAEFHVSTEKAGEADLTVTVTGPSEFDVLSFTCIQKKKFFLLL